METLANNHFCKIRSLLQLPDVYGSWNCFMPKFIFAVLHRKVEVLRELAKWRASDQARALLEEKIVI